MAQGEMLYIRGPGGDYSITSAPARFMVLLGADACEAIWHEP